MFCGYIRYKLKKNVEEPTGTLYYFWNFFVSLKLSQKNKQDGIEGTVILL